MKATIAVAVAALLVGLVGVGAVAAPQASGTLTHVSGATYGEPLVFAYSVDRKVDRAHVLIVCDTDGDEVWEYAEAEYVGSPGTGQVVFEPGNPAVVWSPWDSEPGDAACEVGLYRWNKTRGVDGREALAPPLTLMVDDPRTE